jgi:hypothetical protein
MENQGVLDHFLHLKFRVPHSLFFAVFSIAESMNKANRTKTQKEHMMHFLALLQPESTRGN